MIRILCVGKIKERFFREAIDEYLKRLTKYTKIEIIEVSDEKDSSKKVILNKEKELLNKYINSKDYIVTLEIEGKQISSEELAEKLETTLMSNSNITFIIGGSYGLHDDIKKISDYKLSFSKMTFPHQLFRIILLEQIYRSFRIINNETYHK
jgi:23S rRNA (pseudouridine1915-N3)-methyltransferase